MSSGGIAGKAKNGRAAQVCHPTGYTTVFNDLTIGFLYIWAGFVYIRYNCSSLRICSVEKLNKLMLMMSLVSKCFSILKFGRSV